MKRKTNEGEPKPQLVGFVGVGLDGRDGHQRVTQSDHFVLVGGSAETHERMQDTAVRFAQSLKRTGKPLSETPAAQAIDLLREALDR